MSDYTVIAPPGGMSLDFREVTDIFRAMPGVQNIRIAPHYDGSDSVEAHYCCRGVTGSLTLVEGSVAVHGSDDIALEVAIEFAVRYINAKGVDLYLFNAQYDFLQMLSADIDLATLKRRIDEDPFAGARQQ